MALKRKLKVLVLCGGKSAEYAVSLESAKSVFAALDPKRYLARPVLITKKGKFVAAPSYTTPRFYLQSGTQSFDAHPALRGKGEDNLNSNLRPGVVFIAMHGTYGEDGRIQALLELMGIPYTGSGVLASALAMDKVRTNELFRAHGLTVPRSTAFTKREWKEHPRALFKDAGALGMPLVVKPADLGSSVGVSIVQRPRDVKNAIAAALRHGPSVMAEEFIAGREVTCGVLDDPRTGKPFALPPTEIVPKTSLFFDYHAKYTPGASEEITPAHFPKTILRRMQDAAVKAHTILGCRGMSRTDMIVAKKGGALYVLETNTIPGLTKTSLLPQGAQAAGKSFSQLLDLIIANALRKDV